MKRALIALLLLPLLPACSKGKADQDATPTALVTTVRVARGDIAETATAYGAVEFAPAAERSLSAPVDAVVSTILAPAGTTVTAGQPVLALRLSPSSQLDLNKAHTDAVAAAAAYARAQRLRLTGLDSDADVETARAAAASAGAAAQSLASRSGAALILRAPMAGVVETVTAAPGDTVTAGASLGKIGALSGLRVRLGVEAAAAARIPNHATVHLSPLAGGPEQSASVLSVDPRLDAQTRLASVIVRAPGGGLAPGEPLKGAIVLSDHSGAAVIPRAALLYDQEHPYVFTVTRSVAHRRDVVLGASDDQRVEVTGGLAVGDRIVVDGASALDNGMAVREGAAAPASDAP
ncbi:MAG TPA: efflux RND transporter periplasmic adaptor subunit [Caulobacteraceae bacterium]